MNPRGIFVPMLGCKPHRDVAKRTLAEGLESGGHAGPGVAKAQPPSLTSYWRRLKLILIVPYSRKKRRDGPNSTAISDSTKKTPAAHLALRRGLGDVAIFLTPSKGDVSYWNCMLPVFMAITQLGLIPAETPLVRHTSTYLKIVGAVSADCSHWMTTETEVSRNRPPRASMYTGSQHGRIRGKSPPWRAIHQTPSTIDPAPSTPRTVNQPLSGTNKETMKRRMLSSAKRWHSCVRNWRHPNQELKLPACRSTRVPKFVLP